MKITEKVAFLKGLMEGMDYQPESKDGKLIVAIADILEEMAQTMSVVQEDVKDLYEEVEEISDDIECMKECFLEELSEEENEPLYDEGLYEITCPKCGEVVCVDEDMLSDENLACPNCGTSFEVDFEMDDECTCCSDSSEE